MIDLVKRFFKKAGKSGSENDREQSAHDIRIATCALFLEMAAIDGEFSDTERESFRAHGIRGTPTFILVDSTGVIRYRQVGYRESEGLSIPGWKRSE